ncbi:stalk domain-containing protein [Paenibacillus sp. y28]|uniref:stalk domain-containing protein n=1 Tax=Paenibacillus sp. y28 TaxID=3129110 RepID=UPI0030192F5C
MKKRWLTVAAASTAMAIFLQAGSVLAAPKTIDVAMNQIVVKVNGKTADSSNLLYEGTTYVPIRSISEMMDLPVHYYEATNTAYIGQLPAGEIPDAVIDAWEIEEGQPQAQDADAKQSGPAQIDAVFDQIKIKVHAFPVEGSNLLHNGTTYVPLRAVSDILELDVYYHEPTSTAYIGDIPTGESEAGSPASEGSSNLFPTEESEAGSPASEGSSNLFPIEEPTAAAGSASPFYSVPGEGEHAGWQVLKGHEYEGRFEIYFEVDGSILKTKVEDIRDIDLDQTVEWVDLEGRVVRSSLRDVYQIFGAFSETLTDWLYATFGDLYLDWLESSTINATELVEDYLVETGQLTVPSSGITLQPDTQFYTE